MISATEVIRTPRGVRLGILGLQSFLGSRAHILFIEGLYSPESYQTMVELECLGVGAKLPKTQVSLWQPVQRDWRHTTSLRKGPSMSFFGVAHEKPREHREQLSDEKWSRYG